MSDLRDVLRLPDVRRVEVAWGLSTVAWTGGTVAALAYAFAEGGAVLLAAYSVARAVAGVVVAVLVAGLADRVRRDHLLRATTAGRACAVAVGGAVALLDGPAGVVVGAVVVADGLAAVFRPLQAASLPWLVRTPGQLASANVAATFMESTGSLLGPLLAGVALLVADAPAALLVSAAVAAAALVALLGVGLPEESRAAGGSARPLRDVVTGAGALVRLPPVGGLASLALVQTIARGALMVALVVLALDVLALDQAAIGWLNAAMGVGGLVGGVVAAVVLRWDRLGRGAVGGVALWGVALVLVAVWPVTAVAFLAMLLIGVGNVHQDASLFTLVPRLAGPELAGRALAALEVLIVVGVGIGSVAAPGLIEAFGAPAVLGLAGGLVLAVALAYAVPYVRLDRAAPAAGDQARLVRDLPMFAPLPLVVVEQVAAAMTSHRYRAGEAVVRQGEPGDTFHVVADGLAEVTVDGLPRPALRPGECFGEIALLRHVPRTATVTAGTELTTWSLQRDVFLRAVTGNRVSSDSADLLVRRRLGDDSQPA